MTNSEISTKIVTVNTMSKCRSFLTKINATGLLKPGVPEGVYKWVGRLAWGS